MSMKSKSTGRKARALRRALGIRLQMLDSLHPAMFADSQSWSHYVASVYASSPTRPRTALERSAALQVRYDDRVYGGELRRLAASYG